LKEKTTGRDIYACMLAYKKKKVNKSTRGMPRLSEAMKDVISCDKLRVLAHTN
jgi:hypothetical protein